LLILTTILRRLSLPLLVFLLWTPAAYAWSWPVQGPVLQPFSYDEAHPYAAGQHRGIDIGADATGETVVAPAAGTVSYAGTVPTNGKSITIETADGHSVTLTHLGSILVAKGATVAERDAIGTVGPSGTPEVEGPYVHLGIRMTADPNGYVDPLTLLPSVEAGSGSESGSAASQPASSGSAAGSTSTPSASTTATPAPQPDPVASAAPASRPASTGRTTVSRGRANHTSQTQARSRTPRAETQPRRSQGRPGVRPESRANARTTRPTPSAQPVRRPAVEATAPAEPTGLDAGHEIRPSVSVRQASPSPLPVPDTLLPLILNGAAAIVALSAALATARGRRGRPVEEPTVAVGRLHDLPLSAPEPRPLSRAA
jgi:Peptidase family M23